MQGARIPRNRPLARISSLLLVAGSLAAAGCSQLAAPPTQHVLRFDGQGGLRPPVGPWKPSRAQLTYSTTYFDEVLAALDDHASDHCTDKAAPCRIVVFIHGGLTTERRSARRARELLCRESQISEACAPGPIFDGGPHFPLLVNWNSGLVSSYRDHLFHVQRGRDIGPVGWLGAPFKLVADIARAAGRALIVDYEMLSHDSKTVPSLRQKTVVERDAECYFKKLEEAFAADPAANSPVARCMSIFSKGQRALNNISYYPGLPFKLATAPVVDAFGTVSWDVMLRRTDLLFEEEVFCAEDKNADCAHELLPADPDLERVRPGGLARFLDKLSAFLAARDENWQISVVGHSMGAIITNKIIGRYNGVLPIRNVVYMASAARVKDYKSSAFPFLRDNPYSRVYHLVLHPVAELRERYAKTDLKVLDAAPRGSLLVWIDNFLSKPNSMEERTAGRFANITRAMASTPSDLKPRVHLTVFGAGRLERDQPQKHGDFSKPDILEFWREESWFQEELDDREECRRWEPEVVCEPDRTREVSTAN